MDMKKKIVACLLCMAMAVSTVPMPMVQAAEDNAGIVLYEEGTDTENGEVTTVAADEVQYAKLTGLTGTADSEELTGEKNGNGPIAKALDGKTDTYWHTNWKDDTAPKAETDGTKLTGNNNYIVTLAKPSTVTAVTYVPRNGYESSSGKVNNGAIEQCNVYVTTDDTNWTLAGTIGENNAWSYVNQGVAGADQNFVEKTITFAQAYTGVTKVKIEAIKTAGPQPNQFINAAEFGVIGKENTTQEVLAAALEAAKDVKAKENYTEESYDAYEKALAAVNAITEESTDEEVQAAAKALQKAIAELVEVHKHTLTKTEAKAATCTEAGNSEYYTCSECGKYFSDAEGKNEIAENSWVIEAKGHKLNKTEAKAATCTEAGNSEYYTCSDCGKYFSDADGKNEIAENSWVIEATGHALTKTEAKAATCTEAGNSEYYTCGDCKKYFSDVAGKNEIAKDSWVIKAKGHTITKKETPATADKEGKIEYSCDVCKDYVEKTFVLPKTETSVYMGKTANLISDASKCSITLANAKKYKKYFTLDTKTGKIKTSTKKLSKVKIKKTIPVKVTVDGKAYNVNVKLKIAAPKIKIKRKKIVIGGVSGYRYELQYNIKGATRVKIRVKKMSVLNKKFDANMSKPKSSKSRCYINASSSGLKKLGNKLTFEIVAYYGKNVSQKFIKRI